MKYLLLVYLDETWEKRSLAERQEVYLGQTRVAEDLRARGQYLDGNPLHPTTTATSVRVRDGKRLLTDGPFAETREHGDFTDGQKALALEAAAVVLVHAIALHEDHDHAGSFWVTTEKPL